MKLYVRQEATSLLQQQAILSAQNENTLYFCNFRRVYIQISGRFASVNHPKNELSKTNCVLWSPRNRARRAETPENEGF